MSQQTPISGYRSIPTTLPPDPAEISSMPNAPLQMSDLDACAVSIIRTRDTNAVSRGSASLPTENEIQICDRFNQRKYGPRESRARYSLTKKFESTDIESPDSIHADHGQESLGPDVKEKPKSLKAKTPGLTHDSGHVEEEQKVAKHKDKHHAVENERKCREWIISIKGKLDKADHQNKACPWAEHCIYRIPPQLLDANDEYTFYRQAVTLGPYDDNRATKRVENMIFHKWRALQCTIKRTGHPIEYYLKEVKDLEPTARDCYQGKFRLSSNQFIEMMLLDSCFILDIFRGFAYGFTKLGYPKNDPVFAMRATMHLIQGDMIMLENQIPLFVLNRVLELQMGNDYQKGMVSHLAIKFFEPLTPTYYEAPKRTTITAMKYDSYADGKHCLEVFRRYLLVMPILSEPTAATLENQTDTNLVNVDRRKQLIVHCAIELREAGIKFKRMNTDQFWKIQYKKGVLKIPQLLIHDGTKSLLLNLIAYERCHYGCTNHVTTYVMFMDNLIGTAADVSFLHRHGIIEHWFGNDKEVAELFRQLNRTCQEVVFGRNGKNYLSDVSEAVDKYYNCKWNNLVADLRHTYFTNPWATISLLAAATLLLLTFAQTFYTVYGYYWPT